MLAERLGGPCEAELADSVWRLTGGNPLLLGLAAGTLVADDTASTEAGGVSLSAVERSLGC